MRSNSYIFKNTNFVISNADVTILA